MGYFRDGRFHYRFTNKFANKFAKNFATKEPTTSNKAATNQLVNPDTPFDPRFFDPVYCLSLEGARAVTEGRGTAVIFPAARRCLLLKNYHRGGLMRHISANAYLWTGLQRTRVWSEFELLISMSQLGLPVPDPFACCVEQGTLTYKASLIVEVVENQGSLSQVIQNNGFEGLDWRAIGAFLGRFGGRQIYHADLNASNILVQQNRTFVLIDFDKSYQINGVRAPLFRIIYEKRMLRRLRRSLLKIKPLPTQVNQTFSDEMWELMLLGYRESVRDLG